MTKSKIDHDEVEIRRLDAAWGEAATSHAADKVVSFYSSRAMLVWPGQPEVHGAANILAAWKTIIKQYDGLTLRFDPKRIDFSADRTLATDFGVVEFGHVEKKEFQTSQIMQYAKYLVVWTKEDSGWKVLYDSWNMNDG